MAFRLDGKMRSALLFRLGGLGDLLVCLPSIQLIRWSFPSSSLTLVCREEYGALLREAGAVDRIIPQDGRLILPLFAGPVLPGSPEARWLSEFDLVVGWMQGRSRSELENALLEAGLKNIHFLRDGPGRSAPLSRFFFDQTSVLLGDHRKELPSFEECSFLGGGKARVEEVSVLQAEKGERTGGIRAVAHPGSGSERKCWPWPRFLEIIRRLADRGAGGFLITGEAEVRLKGTIRETSLPLGWTWLHKPPLTKLRTIFHEAALYLGNDSGITHLAAASGTEVIALFLKENEEDWRPFGHSHVLAADSLKDIDIDFVWKKIASLLNF